MRFHKGICTIRGYILLMRKLKTTNCSLQKMSFLIGRCPLFLFHKVSFKGCPTFLAGNFADSNDDDGQSAFTKRVSETIFFINPTGGPPLTRFSLPRIPLSRFLAYVHASRGMKMVRVHSPKEFQRRFTAKKLLSVKSRVLTCLVQKHMQAFSDCF